MKSGENGGFNHGFHHETWGFHHISPGKRKELDQFGEVPSHWKTLEKPAMSPWFTQVGISMWDSSHRPDE